MQSLQEPLNAIMQVYQQNIMMPMLESVGTIPLIGDLMQQTIIFMMQNVMQNVMHPIMVTLLGSVGLEPPPCPFMEM